MFHVVLVQPEIPPNTGNIIRLCANTGTTLHLVEPLGFELDERRLRRAGLDYREFAEVRVHADWATCEAALPGKTWLFTTKASRGYAEATFAQGDALVFGCETRGLPAAIRDAAAPDERLRLPMLPASRSMNLANAVAVAVFEAWRQNGFDGGA